MHRYRNIVALLALLQTHMALAMNLETKALSREQKVAAENKRKTDQSDFKKTVELFQKLPVDVQRLIHSFEEKKKITLLSTCNAYVHKYDKYNIETTTCMATYRDAYGWKIVTGSGRGVLFVRDLATHTLIRILVGHKWNKMGHTRDTITDVTTYQDEAGWKAVSGSHDKTLRLWDLATGTCLYVFTTTDENFFPSKLKVFRDAESWKVACLGSRNTIYIWDLASGTLLARYVIQYRDWNYHIENFEIYHDSEHIQLFVTSDNNTFARINLITGQQLPMLAFENISTEIHRGFERLHQYMSSYIDQTGFKLLYTPSSTDKSKQSTVYVLDTVTCKCIQKLEGHKHPVASITPYKDGNTWKAVVHAREKYKGVQEYVEDILYIWDLATGTLSHTFNVPTQRSSGLTPYDDINDIKVINDNGNLKIITTTAQGDVSTWGYKQGAFECTEAIYQKKLQ